MPLLTDIKAFWKLEEVSGNRFDEVGANDLNDINTVTQAAGIVGNAAKFTIIDADALEIADNVDLSTGDIDFTFAYWALFDALATDQTVLSKWLTTGNQREYQSAFLLGDNRLSFIVSTTGIDTIILLANAFGAPSTGVFTLVICRHNSVDNTLSIQVNNGPVDSVAHAGGVFDSTATFRLGGQATGAELGGRVDASGFWKKVLTADEGTELWNNGNGLEHPFSTVGGGSGNSPIFRVKRSPWGYM